MKQPKFKFGDKVSYPRGRVFGINSIEWNETYSQYQYSSKGKNDYALESVLELYQEPKKNKLYAFISHDSQILFKTRDTWDKDGDSSNYYQLRCPEFDIEYPEKDAP